MKPGSKTPLAPRSVTAPSTVLAHLAASPQFTDKPSWSTHARSSRGSSGGCSRPQRLPPHPVPGLSRTWRCSARDGRCPPAIAARRRTPRDYFGGPPGGSHEENGGLVKASAFLIASDSFASIARLRHDLRQSLTRGTSQYILNGRLHDRAVLKALLAKAENVAKGPQRAPWAAAPVSSPVPCSSASNPPAEALHLPSSRTPSRQYSTFG